MRPYEVPMIHVATIKGFSVYILETKRGVIWI